MISVIDSAILLSDIVCISQLVSGVHQVLTPSPGSQQTLQCQDNNMLDAGVNIARQSQDPQCLTIPVIFIQISDDKAPFMDGDFLHRDCDVLADDKR